MLVLREGFGICGTRGPRRNQAGGVSEPIADHFPLAERLHDRHILSMDASGKLPEHYIAVLGDFGVGKQAIRRRVHIPALLYFGVSSNPNISL
jgi:hypothetical protein